MHIFGYAERLSALKSYIEGRDFLLDLAEVGISAAAVMVDKASYARDPKPFLYGAITLLELSKSSSRKFLDDLRFVSKLGKQIEMIRANHKYIKSSLLITACLVYLREYPLAVAEAQQTLNAIHKFEEVTTVPDILAANLAAFTGISLIQAILARNSWPDPGDITEAQRLSENVLAFIRTDTSS
jgi:hypothetical protein